MLQYIAFSSPVFPRAECKRNNYIGPRVAALNPDAEDRRRVSRVVQGPSQTTRMTGPLRDPSKLIDVWDDSQHWLGQDWRPRCSVGDMCALPLLRSLSPRGALDRQWGGPFPDFNSCTAESSVRKKASQSRSSRYATGCHWGAG